MRDRGTEHAAFDFPVCQVLDAHSELFAKDSPGSSFYILVEGTLDLYTGERGKEFRAYHQTRTMLSRAHPLLP